MAESLAPPAPAPTPEVATLPPRNWLSNLDATGWPLLAGRLIVGLSFLKMGWDKATQPATFLKDIKTYEILPLDPPLLINSIAVLLPWLEIVVALCLLAGILLRGAGVLALGSLLVFTVAIALRALDIHGSQQIAFCAIEFDCGCGGGVVNICNKLFTNLGLMVACLVVLSSRSRRYCLSRRGFS